MKLFVLFGLLLVIVNTCSSAAVYQNSIEEEEDGLPVQVQDQMCRCHGCGYGRSHWPMATDQDEMMKPACPCCNGHNPSCPCCKGRMLKTEDQMCRCHGCGCGRSHLPIVADQDEMINPCPCCYGHNPSCPCCKGRMLKTEDQMCRCHGCGCGRSHLPIAADQDEMMKPCPCCNGHNPSCPCCKGRMLKTEDQIF